MQPGYVIVEEAKPGDRIRVATPHGDAVIVSSKPSAYTYTQPRGKVALNDGTDAIAWIVVFDMIDHARAGERLHTFQHPKDRIARA